MANPVSRLDQNWFSGICELGPRPLVVTGWLKVWMQGHFASTDNIEDQDSPALVRNLWNPDFKKSLIAIESVTQWRPELTEFRPGIIIKCNAWKHVRLGIDNRMIGLTSPDGQNSYSNLWQASHTLFCITGDGAETWKLAAEVFRELNEQAPVVRAILDLMRFEVSEVGELYKLKANTRENFAVPITVGYAYREDWKIVQEAPLVQSINLSVFQP